MVHSFGEQLTKERGVKLDSFLFDDGSDDPTTLWKFNPGFPDRLAKVAHVAANYGAGRGIWLSPWGGYDKPKEQRLANARAQGFEVNEGGFALSGPKYYRYFRDTCLGLIEKYAVNQFKFDGTGNANQVIPGSEFDSDFDAAIHLIRELAREKAGPVCDSHYWNISVAVLAASRRFDLARRRRPQLRWRWHQPPALDHVSGLASLSLGGGRRTAISDEFA